MAEKMYYREQEAAEKLGVSAEKLSELVEQQKLRVFMDGSRRMYKGDEIEALAESGELGEVSAPEPDSGGTAEIELAPAADTGEQPAQQPQPEEAQPAELQPGEAQPSGAQPGAEEPASKEDTVAAAEGASIFDEADLEAEEADPMARTSVSSGVEEQPSSEASGSGSGLLDLTRESDDTSLGAEVLENIDMEGALDTSLQGETSTSTASYAPPEGEAEAAPAPTAERAVPAAAVAAPMDATSGMFGGLVVACSLLALVLGAIVAATLVDVVPTFLEVMKDNLLIVLGGCLGVVVLSAVVGLVIGKSIAGGESPRPQPAEQPAEQGEG